jgi:hypothetical protein
MNRSARLGFAFVAMLAFAWSIPSLAAGPTGNPGKGKSAYGSLGCNQCHGPDPRIGDATVGTTNPVLLSAARDPAWIELALTTYNLGNGYAQSILSMPNYQVTLGDIAEYIYACKITPLPTKCDLTEGGTVGGGGGGGGGGTTNYGGLWWNSPANSESGWGINFTHQGNRIFATWYTYDTKGKAWWLSMLATQGSDGVFTGSILASQGTGFNAPSSAAATQTGTGSLSFTDASNGSFTYTLNGYPAQTKALTKFTYAAVPTCSYVPSPDLTHATNYQDLWWVPTESGWGVNITHQGSQIFATWYSFDVDGTPMWLSVLAPKGGVGAYTTFAGPLTRTSGPSWNAYNPAMQQTQTVGNASFAFIDGNHLQLNATVQVSGMATPVTIVKQLTRFEFSELSGTICN